MTESEHRIDATSKDSQHGVDARLENEIRKHALNALLYINQRASLTTETIDGKTVELSPLESACRAIALSVSDVFSHTKNSEGTIDCAVSIAPKSDPKQARVYAIKESDDEHWKDLNGVHHRQGASNFATYEIPLGADATNTALIYICAPLSQVDDYVQFRFLQEIKPHLATTLKVANGRTKELDANRNLTKKFVRSHLGKNYELAEISILPPYFKKSSGLQLLGKVIQKMHKSNEPLSVMILDFDNFHDYNGAYGHGQGDVALTHLGREIYKNIDHTHPHDIKSIYDYLLASSCPGDSANHEPDAEKHFKACEEWKNQIVENLAHKTPGDFLIRYGGEELVAVLVGATPQQAESAAKRVQQHINDLVIPAPMNSKAQRLYGPKQLPVSKVTVSIGVSGMLPDSMISGKELIEEADGALYAAKDAGRNRVMLYDPATMKPHVTQE